MAATPAGTRNYFERMTAQGRSPQSGPLGATELTVSRLGFGCYRIHEFEPDHREALKTALLSGINLIDTSANYTDGSAERLIGEVTSELFAQGQLKRDEIVIVTKAGYLQGTTLREAKTKSSGGQTAYPDMVEYQNDCWHNISPEFLDEQISKSLSRMKISSIDVLLLHNPEYYLKTSPSSREVYYQRIEKAFRFLETQVKLGRIKHYGISSNTFPEAESRSDFTSLAKVHEIAQKIAKAAGTPSHFNAIQFPFNVYEAGGALSQNNGRTTVFDFAKNNKLAVLTNRPFNAFAKGRLTRLTSFPIHDEVEVKGGLHIILGRAIEFEKKAPDYPKSPQGFNWAHVLRERLGDMDDLLAWREALYQQILPSIRQALSRLPADRQAWGDEYQSAMQELLRLASHDLENLANKKSGLIGEQMQAIAPELTSSLTLSRKVLRIYLSFPQISSILVGMRTVDYVNDAIGTEKPLEAATANEVLMRLQRYRS
jgi:aryl-alcohol dehydrogenase-like predicted oxidoreductase